MTLSKSFIKISEEEHSVEFCVNVKSPIKRNISLQLSYINLTAEGKIKYISLVLMRN